MEADLPSPQGIAPTIAPHRVLIDRAPLVFDIGGSVCKCGFGGDDSPRAVLLNIVGRPLSGILDGRYGRVDSSHRYIGDEAASRGRPRLQYACPIERGVITDWNDLTKMWHHCFFNELRVEAEDQFVLLSEIPLTPHCDRERVAQIMFETFKVPGLFLALEPVLSLYSQGQLTGLLVDCGGDVSHVTSVYEGHALPHTIQRIPLAGQDITTRLMQLVCDKGYSLKTRAEREIAHDVKEKLCFVSLDYDEEMSRFDATGHCEFEYELPDGSIMIVGSERFSSPEILFAGSDHAVSLPRAIVKSIESSDSRLKEELYRTICLSGGTTMFPGLRERLANEVKALAPQLEVNVTASEEAKMATWIGGSILCSLSSFDTNWITKAESPAEAPPEIPVCPTEVSPPQKEMPPPSTPCTCTWNDCMTILYPQRPAAVYSRETLYDVDVENANSKTDPEESVAGEDRKEASLAESRAKLPTGDEYGKQIFRDCSGVVDLGSPELLLEVRPEPLPNWAKGYTYPSNSTPESAAHRKKAFASIWTKKAWDSTTRSGGGGLYENGLKATWMILRSLFIIRLWEDMGETGRIVLLDIPCGDLNWFGPFLDYLVDHPELNIEYYGVDIVPAAIEEARERYRNAPNIHFLELDAVEDSLLEAIGEPVDLIHCRQMLQHLPDVDGLKIVENFEDVGKYLLTTDYPDWSVPFALREFERIRMRKLNLRLQPFFFEDPICEMHDFAGGFLGLWKLPIVRRT